MDAIAWYIATSHELLGHDKTAAMLGVPVGDCAACKLCRYERTRNEVDRAAVLLALAPEVPDPDH
jgi:hypothetical protein